MLNRQNRKFLRLLNNLRLRNKLICAFIIVVIPIIFASVYLTYELRKITLEDAIKKNSEDNLRITKRFNEFLQVPIELSNQFLGDNQLEMFATTDYHTKWQYVKAYDDYTRFNDYLKMTDYISNIRFYINNPTMIDNWRVIQPNQEALKLPWYQESIKNKGLIGWYYVPDFTKNDNSFLTLVRQVRFLQHHQYGVLAMDINTDYINSILNEVSSPTMILINNRVVTSNKSDLVGKTLTDMKIPKDSVKTNGVVDGLINGKKYMVITKRMQPTTSYTNFKIVTLIQVKEIMKKTNPVSLLGLTVIFISLFIAAILIYIFSNFLSKRLSDLSDQINELKKGNFNTKVDFEGEDEIGQVANQFNYMVESIKQLIIKIKETERQKNMLVIKQKEIEFKMLASQINPHFLFNVLESIRMTARLHGEIEIEQLVKRLGKLMRRSLDIGTDLTTIQDELDSVECYLEIQQFRFGDRLTYEIIRSPGTEHFQLPPLTIQPLVENAVVHGLEKKEMDGHVRVETKIYKERLSIKVSDNGLGIPVNVLKEINLNLNNETEANSSHIGLINVHQRLQLTYGPQYGLSINSSLNWGTKVQFFIPLRGDKECLIS
jgi:two-component system, sensor histidine kinase YesM